MSFPIRKISSGRRFVDIVPVDQVSFLVHSEHNEFANIKDIEKLFPAILLYPNRVAYASPLTIPKSFRIPMWTVRENINIGDLLGKIHKKNPSMIDNSSKTYGDIFYAIKSLISHHGIDKLYAYNLDKGFIIISGVHFIGNDGRVLRRDSAENIEEGRFYVFNRVYWSALARFLKGESRQCRVIAIAASASPIQGETQDVAELLADPGSDIPDSNWGKSLMPLNLNYHFIVWHLRRKNRSKAYEILPENDSCTIDKHYNSIFTDNG